MKVFIDPEKNFYKANLHCHTTSSDGRATPEKVKEEYVKRGYSAVAFTDHEHNILNTQLTDENFIAITGCELGISSGPIVDAESSKPSRKVIHMNLYAKDPDNNLTPCYADKYDWYKFDDLRHLVKHEEEYERVYSHEGVNEIVRIAHEKGFLVSLNHPSWSLQNATDYLGYEGFDFIEICNTGCIKSGHPTDEVAYNDMLKAGKKIFCTAADDNHNIRGFEEPRSDSFYSWVMINADKLGYSELMSALERGDFYASTGPEIYSLTKEEDGMVRIKTSPAKRIFLLTKGRRTGQVFALEGETVESAAFRLKEEDVFFRIRVEDEYGKCAYTQAYDASFTPAEKA